MTGRRSMRLAPPPMPATCALLLLLCSLRPIEGTPWDLYDSGDTGPQGSVVDYQLQNGDVDDSELSSVDQLKANIRQLLLENLLQEQRDRHDNSGFYGDEVPMQQQQQKRGRWQGFCFRRTRTGRRLPYICWRESDS